MRISPFPILLTASLASATEPDTPPRQEKPLLVPAAPIVPEDEARRDALARFGVGFLRTRDDRLADALKQYQAVLRNDPQALAPRRELVPVYADLGRDAAAIRTAKEVLARDPDDSETAQRLGRLLMDGRKYAEATQAFAQAAASPRANGATVARLVLLREWGHAAEKAGDHAARETAARGRLAFLSANKAVLLQQGLFTPEEFERRRAHGYEDLGQALVGLKKFDTASAAFETARDLYADPKAAHDRAGVARLHWNLSGSLAAQGEPAKALKELERYLEQRPAGFAPYERWVELMLALKRGGEIPGTLSRLATLDPANPAPAWLAAAALLGRDARAGEDPFRELVAKADKPEYFRVLVKAYESADLPKPFLDLADRLFTAARPAGFYERKSGDAELPPASEGDVRRARFFNEAAEAGVGKNFTKFLIRQLETEAKAGVPRFPDTLKLVMALAAREGQLAPFTTALRASVSEKSDGQTRWLLVICLRHQKNWREIATTADALSLARDGHFYPTIAIEAALAHAELGGEKQALAIVERLEGRIYIRMKKAAVYNILGKPKEALRELNEVLEKDHPKGDNLVTVRLALIGTWHLLKEDAKAEALLREMLDDNPDNVNVLNNLGYRLAEQGRKLDEAETLIRRAIELDHDEKLKDGDREAESGNYLDSLGWVLFKRGKFAEAQKALEDATKFVEASENGIVWDHLGDVYLRLDQKEKAAAAYEKAIKLFTGSHEGRQNGRLDEVKRKLELVKP